jgi:hypothetical protein
VPHRPLALVSGLTIGDYLLWNWSLSHGHDMLALISGVTLPPLLIAALWLIALSVARLLARPSRRSGAQAPARAERRAPGPDTPNTASQQSPSPAPAASSRKIAA